MVFLVQKGRKRMVGGIIDWQGAFMRVCCEIEKGSGAALRGGGGGERERGKKNYLSAFSSLYIFVFIAPVGNGTYNPQPSKNAAK